MNNNINDMMINLKNLINTLSEGLALIDSEKLLESVNRNQYIGMGEKELFLSLVSASRELIENEPEYDFFTARLLNYSLLQEVIGDSYYPTSKNKWDDYRRNTYISYLL